MSIVSTTYLVLLLYKPGAEIDSPWPVGEFRGHAEQAGDASGGFVDMIFQPVNLVQAKQFVWFLRSWNTWINNASVVGANYHLQIQTGEDGQIYHEQNGLNNNAVFVNTSMYSGQHGTPLAPPHRPNGASLINNYTLGIDGNAAGRSFTADVFGYVWNPEARYRAGGLIIPSW